MADHPGKRVLFWSEEGYVLLSPFLDDAFVVPAAAIAEIEFEEIPSGRKKRATQPRRWCFRISGDHADVPLFVQNLSETEAEQAVAACSALRLGKERNTDARKEDASGG